MDYFFNSCDLAIQNAIVHKQYGVHYSQSSNSNTNMHIHDSCEINFSISGGGSFLIDDKVYEVNQGEVFIINQYEPHKITISKSPDIERFVLEICPEFILQCSSVDTDLTRCFYLRGTDISHKISLTDEQVCELRGLFTQIKENKGYATDMLNYAAFINILVFVNKLFALQNMQDHTNDQDVLRNEIVQKIIEFINANYYKSDSTLSLESLSKHSFVSPNQLSRLFKKYTGTTLSKYILSKRLSEAKKLLARGESVTSTAQACGFGDYANFIRVFKRNVGISPGKYADKKDFQLG